MTRGLLASPLGLLIGFSMGALGSGGSVLAVPALVHAAGKTPQEATTVSLILAGAAAVAALPPHYRARRTHARTGFVFGLTGIGGSFAGTALNRRLDPDLLLLAFSALIVVAAWRMLTACPTCTRAGEERAIGGDVPPVRRPLTPRSAVLIFAAGTAVGFLTGLFGVGGGFVTVPILTLLLGFNMGQAIGTSLVVVIVNSSAALLARVATTAVDWATAGAFTATALVGAQLGARMAGRLEPERTLRFFAGALVVLALYTAGASVFSLRRAHERARDVSTAADIAPSRCGPGGWTSGLSVSTRPDVHRKGKRRVRAWCPTSSRRAT